MLQRTLLAVLLTLPASQAWSIDNDAFNRLINEKRFQDALNLVNAQLNSQPKDVEALFLQARTLTRMGRTKEAIAAYKKLIDISPALPEPRNNLAVLHAQGGEYQSAEQALQSALNTNPTYAATHTNLSELYKTLASIAYNKALNLDSGKQKGSVPEPQLRTIDELSSYRAVEAADKRPARTEPAPKEKRSPAPPPAKSVNNAEKRGGEESVMGWARAWSQQDVDAYLDSYSADFIPPGGLSREAWSEQRRERLKNPGFIKVDIKELEIQPLSNQVASATFKQLYQSDRFSETTRKLLILRLDEGAWRIIQESEIR